ncbi:MAG: fibrobacter succinogenes major paralogous domain-containing protein [Tannerellaceae bacterium]|nr:fibrobacter succinogenes major paralogous domain-containing protein [Tannerellaceae bacterium]
MLAGCSKDEEIKDTAPVVTYEDDNAPVHAATHKVWVFGDQTWSDAIQIPECNKESFENSETKPDCRNYTQGDTTWYYYNWAYMDAHKDEMCPSPWRIPSKADFVSLIANTDAATLSAEWGYGGFAYGSSMSVVDLGAYYWSSTVYNSDPNYYYVYYLYYNSDNLSIITTFRESGFQIRCIR